MGRQGKSGLTPWRDIGRKYEGAGGFRSKVHNNKRRSLGMEWSLSKFGTPPPHDSDIPNGPVDIKTHTQTHTLIT